MSAKPKPRDVERPSSGREDFPAQEVASARCTLNYWILRPGYHWLLFALTGGLVGLVEFVMTTALAFGVNKKFDLADSVAESSGLVAMTALLFGLALVLGAAASFFALVAANGFRRPLEGAPTPAAGSGLSAFITYLHGVHKEMNEADAVRAGRNLFNPWVSASKTVGIVLAICAGLAVGREGPSVHIGAGVGWIVAHLVFEARCCGGSRESKGLLVKSMGRISAHGLDARARHGRRRRRVRGSISNAHCRHLVHAGGSRDPRELEKQVHSF